MKLFVSIVLFFTFSSSVCAEEKYALVYPIVGAITTSKYGLRKHPITKGIRAHKGIDLAAPKGAIIRAIREGVVAFSGFSRGYGNVIIIRHSRAMTSLYAHCSNLYVRAGERVLSGQEIATVGNTGSSTGYHLHLEILKDDSNIDPSIPFSAK